MTGPGFELYAAPFPSGLAACQDDALLTDLRGGKVTEWLIHFPPAVGAGDIPYRSGLPVAVLSLGRFPASGAASRRTWRARLRRQDDRRAGTVPASACGSACVAKAKVRARAQRAECRSIGLPVRRDPRRYRTSTRHARCEAAPLAHLDSLGQSLRGCCSS
jgi:hypothetical protein